MNDSLGFALRLYNQAKITVIAAGFSYELDWQRTRCFADFTESDLLRESAWVILCSGFREATVRKAFDLLSLCFCDWESAHEITLNATACRATALAVFRNLRKVDGIIGVARYVDNAGYGTLKEAIVRDPIPELRNFPFIGPVTSWHLAKNLGLEVAKPDRHLARLSFSLGFEDAHHLCASVAAASGDCVKLVDLVFWRYTASLRYDPSATAQVPHRTRGMDLAKLR